MIFEQFDQLVVYIRRVAIARVPLVVAYSRVVCRIAPVYRRVSLLFRHSQILDDFNRVGGMDEFVRLSINETLLW